MSPIDASAAPARRGRPAASPLAVRRRFLQAAEPILAEVGYAAASVEAICGQAGASKRTFYKQFTGKADLVWQLLQMIGLEAVGAYRRHCEGVDSVEQRLLLYLDHWTAHVLERPAAIALEHDPRWLNERDAGQYDPDTLPLHRTLVGLLETGQRLGDFRPLDPEAAAACVRALLVSLRHLLLEPAGRPAGAESGILMQEVRALIAGGLRNRNGAASAVESTQGGRSTDD